MWVSSVHCQIPEGNCADVVSYGESRKNNSPKESPTDNPSRLCFALASEIFFSIMFPLFCKKAPNGLRYPLVGGMRQRRFDGTHSKPHKLLENAQTPTSRVHAVLGNLTERKTRLQPKNTTANL